MSAPIYTTNVRVCEDTNKTFDLAELLIQAGYRPAGSLRIDTIYVVNPDGTTVLAPTDLVQIAPGASGIVISAANRANWNGAFSALNLVIESGNQLLGLNLGVVVDPVNDAPEGADLTVGLIDAAGYVLKESDFGFHDDVEGDAFKSVVIQMAPMSGQLLLNGVALAAGAEVSIQAIRAGQLVYKPDAGASGQVLLGFQVRDASGNEGCNASDLDTSPNHITFQLPMSNNINGRVWIDADHDGIQDSNESGTAGVTVTLTGAGPDGQFGTSDDTTRTATTGSDGSYGFTGIPNGQYKVDFGGKTGYMFTALNAGTDRTADSDAAGTGSSAAFSLTGATSLKVDAGMVVCDTNSGSIGDRVWFDANGNGLQDGGELGAAGVSVQLRSAGADGEVGTADDAIINATTDATGNYLFSGLSAGDYRVTVTAKDGYDFTATNVGNNTNDAIDSDVIANGRVNVTLGVGEANRTVDAGLVVKPPVDPKNAVIGSRVWNDANGNGIQDSGEAGVSGVSVTLKGAGANGVFGDGDDTSATTTTDANGKYSFTGLPAGQYQVQFGGKTGYAGFAKLSSYDSNGDGVVDVQDADFAKLLIWQDLDGNHQTDAGELMTLAQAGVAALTVAYTEQPYLDAQGNLHLERSSATMSNGSSVDMTDVYFNVDAADALAAGVELPTMGELLGVDNALLDQALGGGMPVREQAAIADLSFDAAGEAQRVIAQAMKQADATLAVAG